MAIGTGNDPLSGAPDAGVRGRGVSGAPTPSFSPSAPSIIHMPDPFADYNQNFMATAVGAGPTAVSFPPQEVQTAGSGLAPFKVRWHKHGNAGGSWEVYLPWGCATVDGVACVPVNEKALDADGNVEPDWYKFEFDDGDSVEAVNDGQRIWRSFPVYALMKPWPHIEISAKREDYEAVDSGGRAWLGKIVIANAMEARQGGSSSVLRKAVQYVTEAWTLNDPAAKGLFAIRYDPDGQASDPETKWKAMLTNMTVTCGRFQVSSYEDEDVTENELVVLKIDHSEDGKYKLEIQGEEGESDDNATYITLYKMKDGVVKSDFRTNITTMPFFDA